MATQCDKCRGSGLVGVGESPHLQVGPVSTCDKCLGKGVLEKEVEEDLKKTQALASELDGLEVGIVVKVGDEGQLSRDCS